MKKNSNKKIKKNINTLIVSDIHLGSHHCRSDDLIALLDTYNFKRLVLNGDILNGLHLSRLHSGHWEFLSRLRGLSASCQVVWIAGNHDTGSESLFRLLGIEVYSKYVWNYNGWKFLAIHGHQFDKFFINSYILSQIVYFLYELLRRVDKKEWLVDYIRLRNKTWRRGSEEVASGALRFGKLLGVNYVFCGHTHKILEKEKWGIKYMNTASWVEKTPAYIVVSRQGVELKRFEVNKNTY